ncbi:lysophospholipid acyltransferase family protein [Propylenella binzhouense]|uniref:lysophospholipid acyltransferase family protein n=1 Tax=Propylenella binzhouense TaxID=2555902 RepID=UPI00196777B8|nr:lipid A biosynthesis acyltransferase [Propylenella binzhouense]
MGEPNSVKGRRRRRAGLFRRAGEIVEYAGLRTVAALVRALPVDSSSSLMGAAWECVAPRTRRHRRVLENLRRAFPDKTEAEREAIARAQWNNLGRTFAETFQIDRILADGSRFEVVLPDAVRARIADCPTGAVFVALHSANWEVAAWPLRSRYSLAGIYQKLSNPRSDRYVTGLRSELFDGGLFSKGHTTPGRVMRWVRSGNAIGLLGDHRETNGVPVTFFGREATANPFPAMLARRLHVPLFAGRVVRLAGSRFRIDGVEIPVPETNDPTADVLAATQSLQAQFEAWIRERPQEWMWVHDRWRIGRRRKQAGELGIAAAKRT